VIKTVVLVLIAGLFGGTGHVLLAKGMKTVGDLTEAPSSLLGGMIVRAVSNPWLILGVVCQATFFFMYLTLLSREDLSKILPMVSFDYIVVATLAYFILGEPVTPARWTGIGFIVLGVFLVSRT
jgi:drug/metabolite transporter (DMT)-like permease